MTMSLKLQDLKVLPTSAAFSKENMAYHPENTVKAEVWGNCIHSILRTHNFNPLRIHMDSFQCFSIYYIISSFVSKCVVTADTATFCLLEPVLMHLPYE